MPLTVDAAFKAAVKVTHQPTRRVVVVDANLDDHDVLIRSGSLSWTAGGYPSCQGTVEIADLDDQPLSGSEWLLPYGARVQVYAGYKLPSGDQDEVLVADLVVTGVEQRQPEQTLVLTCASDEALVQSDAFALPAPRYDDGLGDTGAWYNLQQLVARTLPSATISLDDTLVDPGLAVDTTWDGDPWSCVVTCLEALEAQAWFDPDRVLHVRSASTAAGTPDATLSQGTTGSTVVGASSTWLRTTNTVTVRGGDGAADGATITGDASRTGAQDPTGAMGPVRLVESRPTDGTTTDLDAVAAGLLRLSGRRARTVTIDTAPKPWIVLGDTVRVVWSDEVEEDLIVRSLSLSLTPADPMSLELAEALA